MVVFTYDMHFLVGDDGVMRLGKTDRMMHVVYVYGGLHGALCREVVLHELAHAFLHSYGFRLPSEYEEAFCSFFGSHADEIIGVADELYYDNIRTVK